MRTKVPVVAVGGALALLALAPDSASAEIPAAAQVVRDAGPAGSVSLLRIAATEVMSRDSGRFLPLASQAGREANVIGTARRTRCYRRKIEHVERSLGIRQWTLTLRQRWCGRGRKIVSKRRRCGGDAGFNWRLKNTSSATRLTRSRRGGRTKCRGWFHLDYSPIFREEERGFIVFDFTGRGATRIVRMGSR